MKVLGAVERHVRVHIYLLKLRSKHKATLVIVNIKR